MHFLTILLLFILTLEARDSYELQLFATKSDDFQGVQRMLSRGQSAGLECYENRENRLDGVYTFIRCNKTNSYQNIAQAIQKAKMARLNYYLLKPDNSAEKAFKVASIKEVVVVMPDDLSELFFGNNKELMQILHNKNQISKSELAQRKAIYLKNVASSEKISGFSLRGNGSNNFDIQRLAYNVRLQWDILDGGFLGSQKDAQKTILKKELEYERIMDDYRQLNLELSLYKMHAINNYINYHFLKEQEQMLFNMIQRAQKKYAASLITSSIFFKRKKAHDHIKHKLSYYEALEKEQYDKQLKPLMSRIEYVNMVDKQGLAQYAYVNSIELKNSKNKIKFSNIQENWTDRLKTNVYVEKKKIVYLNNSETIAGLQLQLPLDFNNDNAKYKDIEIEANALKAQSLKRVIARNIDEIYNKIKHHKSYIKTLKSDIDFFNNESKALHLKSIYPLEKQTKDLQHEREMLKFAISKHNQEIWQERTEILKLLLKLQNISGVQVLPV